MSIRIRALLFVLGAAAFVLLVAHAGPAAIARDVRALGWMLAPIILLYALVYLCSAAAWYVVMSIEPVRPPFVRAYAITISAFALNFVTPVVNAGGEPFRVAASASWIGTSRAAGSTVLYTMLHAMSSLLLWFSALVLALVMLPHTPALVGGIAVLLVIVAGMASLVLAGHRGGVLARILNVLQRLPLIGRFARTLEWRRAALVQVDRQIMDFYHRSPGRFLLALGLDFTGRFLAVGEFYLICRGLGVPIGWGQAYLIGGLLALAINASFFMPFELGSKEAGLYFIYRLAGLDPALGVSASVITRVRELTWVGVGLALIWVSAPRLPRATAPELPDRPA